MTWQALVANLQVESAAVAVEVVGVDRHGCRLVVVTRGT